MKILVVFLILYSSFSSVSTYNYLIISPVFGYSHMKFMGKIADILADNGHNVTLFQPVIYDFLLNKKVVKNMNVEVINYHIGEDSLAAKSSDDGFSFFWEAPSMGSSITGALLGAKTLYSIFEPICEKMLKDTTLHDWILAKNFDSHITEAFDFCGLYLGDLLKLKAPIPLYSGVRCAAASHAVGEPFPLNYLPTQNSNYHEKSSLFSRFTDITSLAVYYYQFGYLFDMQYTQASHLTNGNLRNWKDILTSSTFYLTNSNPYLSFVTPTIPKVINIGGFTIDPPKSENLNLSEEFEEYLTRRNSTILVSFGTLIRSADMPERFKSGLINSFKMMSETTFIWKYEEDDSFLKNQLPENVILSEWVPQPALLADPRLKIFVTHGGLGSTMEVAYAGIPAIMIPIFSDQSVNAQMLARHGGALVYDKQELTDSEKLVEYFQKILHEPSFKRNAENLAEILRNQPMDPKQVLLNHCVFAAKFGNVDNLTPYSMKYGTIEYYNLDIIAIGAFGIVIFTLLSSFLTFKLYKMYYSIRKTKTD